ncbi:hypothetical protein K523DRAFT_28228 [Schizophyllum commune Tattone D]|nr:hypothetical protein K523DRAFT_28228 [Schizophyllum commune Tattone D]
MFRHDLRTIPCRTVRRAACSEASWASSKSVGRRRKGRSGLHCSSIGVLRRCSCGAWIGGSLAAGSGNDLASGTGRWSCSEADICVGQCRVYALDALMVLGWSFLSGDRGLARSKGRWIRQCIGSRSMSDRGRQGREARGTQLRRSLGNVLRLEARRPSDVAWLVIGRVSSFSRQACG